MALEHARLVLEPIVVENRKGHCGMRIAKHMKLASATSQYCWTQVLEPGNLIKGTAAIRVRRFLHGVCAPDQFESLC